MTDITHIAALRRLAPPVPDHDEDGSRVATGLTLAGLGMAASAVPGGWERTMPRQVAITTAAALVGFGAGATVAEPVSRTIGGGDPLTGGVALGTAGAVAALVGHHVPNDGALRDVGHVVSSSGALAIAGGGAAAVTSLASGGAHRRIDNPLGVGAVTGGLGGAVLLGALALTGGLRRAPSVAEAARSLLEPSAEAAARWTPELANADFNGRYAAAKAALLELPGTSEQTWKQIASPGRTFLRGVATPADILKTSGVNPARAPRRLVVGAREAQTSRELADLMLARFDAADGLSYGTVHVVSPAAIGDTDEVVPLAVEHATGGDTITLLTQAVQSEPYFVLHKQAKATQTLEYVLEGLQQRIAAQPADQRSKLLLSALCYGSLSPVRLGPERLAELGVDHALLEGSPAISRRSRTLVGELERGERPGLLAWSGAELDAFADSGAPVPRLTMLLHRDDALRAGLNSVLVPPREALDRPYMPVMTALNTFGDFGADTPKAAGSLLEVGHQFRATGVRSANAAFGLKLDAERRAVLQDHAVMRDRLRDLGRSSAT